MEELLVTIAVLLAVAGNLPYLFKILKKEIQPHPYTWLVWSVVSMITLFGGWAKGGGIGVIPILASEIFTVIIFLFSIRYGFKEIKKRDTYFLVVALLGLIPWFITSDPTISIIVVVLIDLVAFLPTIIKTWEDPKSETWILFASNVARHILILFTIESFNIATSLHSFAMILTNLLMTGIILFVKK